MTDAAKTVLERWQVRKSKKQKEAFRQWLCAELENLGYSPAVEGKGSRNVVVGDPDSAKLLLTAHYDTCAVLPFPNFITPRNLAAYLLYQLLICIPIFAIPVALEVGVMLLWDYAAGTDCPAWLAVGTLYAGLLLVLWWMMAGPANRHTVNDNTSGVLTLLEIAAALPEADRGHTCLVFFDNEEKGLLGSQKFVSMHKAAKKNALTVNFDCVSDGDFLQLYPEKRVKKEPEAMAALEAAFQGRGEKTVEVVRGFGFYPSDNKLFARGVGVCALKKKPLIGYYMDRIHTGRDTVLEEENILLLRDGALRLAESLNG